jgi:hypothetical protein
MEVSNQHNSLHSFLDPRGVRELGWTKNYNFIFSNLTQPNPTQPNPTQPNPTQPNLTQPNPTQPNPTQPNLS